MSSVNVTYIEKSLEGTDESEMKKQICITIFLIMSMLTGCTKTNQDEETKKSMRIGVSVYDQYDTFVASLIDSLNHSAKLKEQETGISITVDIVNASRNQFTQNEQVISYADKNYDIICVNLVDRTDTSVIIDKVKSSGIPIIFFNRQLVEEDLERWDKLYYVGATAEDSGILQGDILAKIWAESLEEIDSNQDGKMQYVMLEGEAGHQDALVRTEYSINTIMKDGIVVDKLANGIANWNREQAATQMKIWINKYGKDIEVAIANNDDMALGVLDALESLGIEEIDYPVIVGIDGTKEALTKLQAGNLAGTVLNDEYGQAKAIVELAYSLSMNTDLPQELDLVDGKYIRIPYQQVTTENVDEIIEMVGENRTE